MTDEADLHVCDFVKKRTSSIDLTQSHNSSMTDHFNSCKVVVWCSVVSLGIVKVFLDSEIGGL
jgi:hypothetical protein